MPELVTSDDKKHLLGLVRVLPEQYPFHPFHETWQGRKLKLLFMKNQHMCTHRVSELLVTENSFWTDTWGNLLSSNLEHAKNFLPLLKYCHGNSCPCRIPCFMQAVTVQASLYGLMPYLMRNSVTAECLYLGFWLWSHNKANSHWIFKRRTQWWVY